MSDAALSKEKIIVDPVEHWLPELGGSQDECLARGEEESRKGATGGAETGVHHGRLADQSL